MYRIIRIDEVMKEQGRTIEWVVDGYNNLTAKSIPELTKNRLWYLRINEREIRLPEVAFLSVLFGVEAWDLIVKDW